MVMNLFGFFIMARHCEHLTYICDRGAEVRLGTEAGVRIFTEYKSGADVSTSNPLAGGSEERTSTRMPETKRQSRKNPDCNNNGNEQNNSEEEKEGKEDSVGDLDSVPEEEEEEEDDDEGGCWSALRGICWDIYSRLRRCLVSLCPGLSPCLPKDMTPWKDWFKNILKKDAQSDYIPEGEYTLLKPGQRFHFKELKFYNWVHKQPPEAITDQFPVTFYKLRDVGKYLEKYGSGWCHDFNVSFLLP